MTVPDFFIVGAPKCGTTALSEYLRSHPNVYLSWPKEPHYFAEDFDRYRRVKTLDEYLELFRQRTDRHLAVGEASVWYLYSRVAIRRIREFNERARIIVMLRNPVDMVHSLHAQMVFSFYDDVRDFREAWELQDARRAGRHIPEKCPEPAHLQYEAVGRLGEQLKRVYARFPASQVKVVLQEDFARDTRGVYRDVLSFLDLPDDGRTTFPRINVRREPRVRSLSEILHHPPPPLRGLMDAARTAIRALGVRELRLWHRLVALNSREADREPLPPAFRRELTRCFETDIRELSRLLGRPLDHWLS